MSWKCGRAVIPIRSLSTQYSPGINSSTFFSHGLLIWFRLLEKLWAGYDKRHRCHKKYDAVWDIRRPRLESSPSTRYWNVEKSYKLLWVSIYLFIELVQFSSAAQSCPTLCSPMNRRTPGLPVHHQLPESTHTHVQWVSDAIQPSHPLSSPSSPAPSPSQHQGLFQWVNSSHEVAKVLRVSASTSVL